MKKEFSLSVLMLLIAVSVFGQKIKDKGVFTTYKNYFYESVLKALDGGGTVERKTFKANPEGLNFPTNVKEFTAAWHNKPISQGRTGTCWDFSTISFIESDVFRLTGKKVKLSEMYIAYYEYIAKAEEFIKTKGKSTLGEGSEGNAVTRQMKRHGIIPAEVYSGNVKEFPDHKEMFKEINALLQDHKKRNSWNKDLIISKLKAILNTYMGAPPAMFDYLGKRYTALSFMKEYLKLNPDDYIEIMSLMEKPYYQFVEYEVPDNYWHSKDYFNVPLDVFMNTIKKAVKNGYTLSIGGDVSEAGYLPEMDVAYVPTFDIPSEYIDESARQFRFSNRSTTDDHGIHLVGYKIDKDGKWWFLIKDSGSSSRNGKNKGYSFYHEDYVKLKMMGFTVHKSAVKELMKKIEGE